ncbi:Plasmodium exported protein (PHISTa), unknown function [Plasmodium sp. gorilla clade G2]|uniref:Plasmodium exported protein (PHISTa), unknown function n=1 Tax=Plasmodium sp. gorilla clade G2 TaxID=880535 RepID=UPI000D2970EA|nr:Plasmodium exported protein (PHISTa), unknown function [Plasmodium sp. gorilla clade G2]SOV20077.1 Plasmodium exported protein (PHISTa), unknown function [Plasmodium sp. gorilla clade G2]
MTNKKNCTIFTLYSPYKKRKRKLYYMSFKFVYLSLYIVVFYYVFLNNSLENSSLEIAKNCNVYIRNLVEAERNFKGSKRKQNSKLKKEDMSKTKSSENNNKCDEQKIEENKHSTNNDNENNHVENKSNISISNINYNDISKRLSEKELFEVLNSFEECPSNDDLRYIWSHTMGVAKEVLDHVFKESKASIQKYLDNDILKSTDAYGFKFFVYDEMWKEYIYRFSKEVAIEEVEYTNKFFSLIKDKHTYDDILKFIYSFLENFKTVINELLKSTDAYGFKFFVYDEMWKEYIYRFSKEVAIEEVEYTNKFFSLIKDKHTYDDILKFIYSFLENFKTVINELNKKHHKELLETVAKHVNKKR